MTEYSSGEYDYDIAIIGGGIHGAGIAQAGAAAGYRVICLEQGGWGAATSSQSSKLIHGGLRYLQTGQLGLVRRCLQERDRLLQLAPDLVWLRRFYIPVYRQGRYSPEQIRWALRTYYLLSGMRNTGQYTELAQEQWGQLTGLQTRDLLAVFQYYDGQTDDRRLTQAVVRSAQSLGAEMCSQARFSYAERKVKGYNVRWESAEGPHGIRCRVLINAAGPWVQNVMAQIEVPPAQWQPAPMELVQGTHLIYEGALVERCYYVEAPEDGRAVFILPWLNKTLVGTTETPYAGIPEDISPTQGEIDYLKQTLAFYFPFMGEEPSGFLCGLRVLPGDQQAAFFRDRDTRLVMDDESAPNLMALYGGKLTDYRATSAKVIRCLRSVLGEREQRADTAHLFLADS